ncbi:MAG: hypothetical protein K1X81_12260 [Bacteroidia bacterium]|nr:hypothetical protein [Bacteroidia bacterium]
MKVILILSLLLLFNSCQHCNDPTNPDCGNYNPCYGASNVADFECTEYFDANNDLNVKCDTLVFGTTSCLFNSKMEYFSYDWQIGSDTNHRYGKTFTINFNKSFGSIPVTLIGKRAPNPKCIPNDDGVDTFTKPITIVDWKASPIMGRYTGSLISNPYDTFTIEIRADHNVHQLSLGDPILLNLMQGCDVIFGIDSKGYKQFISYFNYYTPSGVCNQNTEIRGMLDQSNQFITITYRIFKDPQGRLTETFIGKRQP